MRPLAVFALVLAAPVAGHAQDYRPAHPVDELSSGDLDALLGRAQGDVAGCATRTDTSAYLAEVRATVSPGAAPSTLWNARVSVSVRSRPRDHAFESCAVRAIRESLREEAYAVGRTVRARRTFQVQERPDPPEPPPAVAFSEGEARSVLSAASGRLARCVDVAGVPEAVTLYVTVEQTGRMVLVNATLPPGTSPHALGCLSSTVSSLSTRGRPARRVQLTHRVGLRS